MQNNYSDDRLRLAARLYYVDGLAQNEVAKFVKVSKAKVSRLLSLARERGIVRITVADYESRNRQLEAELRVQLDLKEAIVIKTFEGMVADDLRRAVGHFGAEAVEEIIQKDDTIVLSGGRTIQELVSHFTDSRQRSLTLVQSMGSVDSKVSSIDAQEVGRVMAQRLGGHFLALNTPAFLEDQQTRDGLLKLEQVKVVHERIRNAQLALIGVGTLANSVFIERGVLSETNVTELQQAGAVGEICGRFINADGNECETSWRDRAMSIEFEELRRIPQVLAVVSGSDRSEALQAAIKGKLIKGLVIDEAGASALLAASRPHSTPSPDKK